MWTSTFINCFVSHSSLAFSDSHVSMLYLRLKTRYYLRLPRFEPVCSFGFEPVDFAGVCPKLASTADYQAVLVICDKSLLKQKMTASLLPFSFITSRGP